MVNKKDLILAVIATFCVTVALFSIMPTNSIPPYDPWADINDDGKLDMIDMWYEASLYGALGDPTKNVTVTNWPIRRTLNASLAYGWVIDGSQAWQLEAEVTGYSKVNLLLKVESYGSGVVDVLVYFIIGGVWTRPVYFNHTLSSGTYFLLENYEVIGPTILIEFAPSGTVRVFVGIYATD